MSRALACLLLALAFVASIPGAPVYAAVGGDLDLSFSGDGKLIASFEGEYSALDVAIQEDGKILVVGTVAGDAALARFNSNGSPDTTFSGDGLVRTDFGPNVNMRSVAIQPNGRIVIVGQGGSFPNPDNSDVAIARYLSTGALDTSLLGDGKAFVDLGMDETGAGVAVQADGRIVVVGLSQVGDDNDFMVSRLLSSGAKDDTFDGDGIRTVGFGGDNDRAEDVVIQPDGKIVVAGLTDSDGFLDFDFAVARFTTSGSLDPSFNFDGRINSGFDYSEDVQSVALQPDGKIVVGGTTGPSGSSNFALARYTVNGIDDDSFDGDGKLTVSMGGDDRIDGVTVQPDGRIIATGSTNALGDFDFATARLNSGGSLNTSFGGDGRVITDLGRQDSPDGVAIQADGKIVVAGTARDGTNQDFALVRYHWQTDSPPNTTIDSGPTGTTSDSTPTFTFSASEAATKFECSVDSGSYATCASPRTLSELTDGSHTFRVRAYDSSAQPDPTPATRTFTVDTPPQTTINSGPSGPTSDPTPTFGFSSDEPGSSFECRVDSNAFAPCTSPHTTPTLLDGPHTFEVRAIDSDGTDHPDPSPALRSFTVDATPPDTIMDSAPSGTITDSTPTFEFHSTEPGTLRCSLDGAPSTTCTSPKTIGPLEEGPHTYTVTAVDGVGNVDPSPVTASFSVDTMPPDTLITGDPPSLTKDSTPTFSFTSTEAGSAFECALDGGDWASCTSPFTSPQVLLDGPHTFAVRATDSTSHVDASPAVHAFTVDTVPPGTVITSGPSGTTTKRTVTFRFSALDEAAAGFQCKLDDRAWRACTSPRTYADLARGAHVFRVRALDAAGNRDLSPARRDFRIVAG